MIHTSEALGSTAEIRLKLIECDSINLSLRPRAHILVVQWYNEEMSEVFTAMIHRNIHKYTSSNKSAIINGINYTFYDKHTRKSVTNNTCIHTYPTAV